MIRRIHHVGIVVASLADGCAFWRDTLGLPLLAEAVVADQGVRAALLGAGESEVELLEPLAPDTGVGRFLARRGGGLHHLCFDTHDVGAELARLVASGLETLDAEPRVGLAGRIAFLHPRACAGVLVELATPPPAHGVAVTPLAFDHVTLAVEAPGTARDHFARTFGLAPPPADSTVSSATSQAAGSATSRAVASATSRVAAPTLAVGGSRLVFAPSAAGAGGIASLTLATDDVAAVEVALGRVGVASRATWSRLAAGRPTVGEPAVGGFEVGGLAVVGPATGGARIEIVPREGRR